MSRDRLNRTYHQTRTLSFTSGKGGVGKTTVVTNLAVQLARRGRKILLLDGDLGMANIDVMMGVKSPYSIIDVVKGEKALADIIVDIDENISLIPGGSGVYELTQITSYHKQALLDQVSDLEKTYDYMLIDTAPGIDNNVLYLNSAAQEINVILTPDPSSMTDAYALIKVLNQRQREERFHIICNQVKNENEGYALYQRLCDVSSKFLYVSLEYRGSVPADSQLRIATRRREIISSCNRRAPSSLAISDIAEKFSGSRAIDEVKGGLQFFWQQMVGVA